MFAGWVFPEEGNDDLDCLGFAEESVRLWGEQVPVALMACTHGIETIVLEISVARPARQHLESLKDSFDTLDRALVDLAIKNENEEVPLTRVTVTHRRKYPHKYQNFPLDQRGPFSLDERKCIEGLFPRIGERGILVVD